ncbi:50S ribosomal protein L24 [Candidatus Parcubacteria bacterium]|nr:50S ribosomal protein L24 [Candidatus Parcubacteria bacterium]
MKIKKGDQVLIISGKDRARKGKVLQVIPKEERVLVEGINIRKKSVRPKKSGEKGQIVEMPGPISISNLKLICPKCKKATRVEYKIIKSKEGSKRTKIRICKKCQSEI